MRHQMTLFIEPFRSIKSGRKTVEVRLNSENKRQIQIGDTIEFELLPDRTEKINVLVEDLMVFKTFEEMYSSITFKEFDCDHWTMNEMIDATYKIYSSQREAMWGALGIRIKLIENELKL